MQCEFGLVYPLWRVEHGADELLERAVGEVGLDHLTIPLVTGSITQFQLTEGAEHPSFETEGGWHYPPNKSAYAATGLKPRAARWVGKRNGLETIRGFAAQHNLKLRLRIDLRSVASLAEHERHLCQRNAWGEQVPAAGVCVTNPDTRELLRETIDELLAYEPSAIEIVNWLPHHAIHAGAERPLDWHRQVRELLDVCFCAACREAALLGTRDATDFDPDAAARSVRTHVGRLTADCTATPIVEVDLRDDVVSAYLGAVHEENSRWLLRIAERYPQLGRWALWDVTCREVPSESDCGWKPIYRTDANAASSAGQALSVWKPAAMQSSELVSRVVELVDHGTVMIDFEDLEQAPHEAIDWLRQAVRYGRRR